MMADIPFKTGGYLTHEYGYCSNGEGPWAFAADGLSVAECAAKCTALGCKCFDYACAYHPFDNWCVARKEPADICKADHAVLTSRSIECSPPLGSTCPQVKPVVPVSTALRVAAVGDSITAGYLSSCGLNYPNQMQSTLGPQYSVKNFGIGGTTLLRHADHPWWNTSAFAAATASAPDIVVIALGTNDAKTQNWGPFSTQFSTDYASLINHFRRLPSQPSVILVVPPPLYRDGRYGMEQEVINTALPRLVPSIARANGLPPPVNLFDLFEAHCPVVAGTPGHPPNSTDVYCDWIGSGGRDACHPSDLGYAKVADAVARAVRLVTA